MLDLSHPHYKHLYQGIWHYCYWLSKNREDAHDLCQSTFVRFYQKPRSLTKDGYFCYLKQIAHRLFLDRKRLINPIMLELYEELVADEHFPQPTPLVDHIKKNPRYALLLDWAEGMTHDELAKKYNTTVGGSRCRLTVLKRRLRQETNHME